MRGPNEKRPPEGAQEVLLGAGQESNEVIVPREGVGCKEAGAESAGSRLRRREPASRRDDWDIRVEDAVLKEVLLTGLTLPDPQAAHELVGIHEGKAAVDGGPTKATEGTWPVLEPAAMHGPVGEIVRCIAEEIEPHPASILIQLLVGLGSIVGDGPYFCVAAERHTPKLFCVLVGDTSKARKGTSYAIAKAVLEELDPEWASRCVYSGLSTGEGLLEAFRLAEEGTSSGDVIGTRLFVYEGELATPLSRMARDGNTLSAVIRDLWDRGESQVMNKQCPIRIEGARLGIVAHITQFELQKVLGVVETRNGFANRFLWVATRRVRNIPLGTRIDASRFSDQIGRIEKAIQKVQGAKELRLTEAADALWAEVYAELSEPLDGAAGDLTARGEAMVLRLALLYAVLDGADAIDVVHIKAGLAVWRYCEASVQYIWGNALGDPVAERIWDALQKQPRGMSRGDIVNMFCRKKSKPVLDTALDLLMERGLVISQKVLTGGRSRTVYHPLYCDPAYWESQIRAGGVDGDELRGGGSLCSLTSPSAVLGGSGSSGVQG